MTPRSPQNAAAPAPTENARYCHTCGRIISPRKSNPRTPPSTPQKYCSDRCRREKPSSTGHAIEAEIENAFIRLLGDDREQRIVKCGDVQHTVFTETSGAVPPTTEASEGALGKQEITPDADHLEASESEEEEDGGVRLPNSLTSSVMIANAPNEINEAHLSPQAYGLKVAKQREQVRQTARRGVAFGFAAGRAGGEAQQKGRRRLEAVQYGRVVEASFAKGEWGVRWRD